MPASVISHSDTNSSRSLGSRSGYHNSVAEISAPLLGDSFKGPDIELAALDVKQGRGPRRRDQLPDMLQDMKTMA
ncbi:MAG: hypothetical protein NTX57_14080 [Armatimonadetes bacterium]|nr:hypothetical protein [Armatimonadota bacterium]